MRFPLIQRAACIAAVFLLSPVSSASAQFPTVASTPACGASAPLSSARLNNVARDRTPTVGVLYFAGGSTRGDDPQLAEAVTTEVVNSLSRATGMSVVRGDQWIRSSGAAAYVLTGNVARVRSELRVRVRLNHAESGQTAWSAEFTRNVLDMPALGAEIAAEAARHVGATPDTSTVPGIGMTIGAYDQLLLGEFNLERWDAASLTKAAESLALATGFSTGAARPYARYGAALGKMGEWGYPASAPADSLLAWGSLTAEHGGVRALADSNQAAAAEAFGMAAMFAALRGDDERARSLATRAKGHPAAIRATALMSLPANPTSASRTLANAAASTYTPALVDRAMLALSARRDAEACSILDAAVAADPRSAPAFALRALVRMRNGDMRGGWADADMSRQLGRASWGDALDLLAATRVADRQELLTRVQGFTRAVRGDTAVLSVLDARLTAIALTAAGEQELARTVLARMRQSDPRRSLTLGEATPGPRAANR